MYTEAMGSTVTSWRAAHKRYVFLHHLAQHS